MRFILLAPPSEVTPLKVDDAPWLVSTAPLAVLEFVTDPPPESELTV